MPTSSLNLPVLVSANEFVLPKAYDQMSYGILREAKKISSSGGSLSRVAKSKASNTYNAANVR